MLYLLMWSWGLDCTAKTINKNNQSTQKAAEIFVNNDWNVSQAAVPAVIEVTCCVCVHSEERFI